jgi:hypothetical protein
MKFLFENNRSSFAVAGNDPSTTTTRDVIIKHRGGSLSRISELNSKYDPLHYVLLHPRGELGWSPEIKEVMPQATAMNYYAYKLAFWYPDYSLHHWSGRLFQQYCVDQYVKIETERLSYILYNQDNFRVEQYYGVVDAYENGVKLGNDTGTIPFQFFPIYLLISYFHDVIFFIRSLHSSSYLFYWWSERYESKIPGCNGFSPVYWKAKPFHNCHMQPRLA